MGYHHTPYQQGNVQGGQPRDSGYNNQRTSRSHSQQPTAQIGDNPTLNRSLSAGRSPIPGQTQPFDAYGAGQNREPGPQYVPSTNTPQYLGVQGQVQSASYQDLSQPYQSAEQYYPVEGPTSHLVLQQSRTHQSPPQQPSMALSPSLSVQGQYSQYQHGDVEYPAGHPQRRSLASQYTQQQQQQPSTQLYSQQPQPSQPQYQQQQLSTQPYSQHQQSSHSQQRRQYQPSSQQYPQQQQQPSSQQYTQQQQQPSTQQYMQQQQGNFAASSFGANVPGEIYEMPGDEIRQSRSTRRGTCPLCRLENCRNPAVREVETQELTEYCSLDHMQEDIRRGAPLCPACNKCPRRINGRYCGSPCEKWDRERPRQPHQQQQHYPRPPSGARPHLSAPSPSGLVHCRKCNMTYSARGSSRPRYGGQEIPDVSLPPCPTCGFCP